MSFTDLYFATDTGHNYAGDTGRLSGLDREKLGYSEVQMALDSKFLNENLKRGAGYYPSAQSKQALIDVAEGEPVFSIMIPENINAPVMPILSTMNGLDGLEDGESLSGLREELMTIQKMDEKTSDLFVAESIMDWLRYQGIAMHDASTTSKSRPVTVQQTGIAKLFTPLEPIPFASVILMRPPTQAEVKAMLLRGTRERGLTPGKILLVPTAFTPMNIAEKNLLLMNLYFRSPSMYSRLFSSRTRRSNARTAAMESLIQDKLLTGVFFTQILAEEGVITINSAGASDLGSGLQKVIGSGKGASTKSPVFASMAAALGLIKPLAGSPSDDRPTRGMARRVLNDSADRKRLQDLRDTMIRRLIYHPTFPNTFQDSVCSDLGIDDTELYRREAKTRRLVLRQDTEAGLYRGEQTTSYKKMMSALYQLSAIDVANCAGITTAPAGPGQKIEMFAHKGHVQL